MNIIELVREKLKSIPLEVKVLENRGIFISDNGYETIIFRNSISDQNLIKFEKHTSLSIFDNDFIRIYNRIRNIPGACFIKDSCSNEYQFIHKPFCSDIITKDLISGEVLEILLMLNISLVVRNNVHNTFNVIKLLID